MRQALKTIKKHKSEIENSFVLPRLTNGPIEGVNNHIKVIKRIAYGYIILSILDSGFCFR